MRLLAACIFSQPVSSGSPSLLAACLWWQPVTSGSLYLLSACLFCQSVSFFSLSLFSACLFFQPVSSASLSLLTACPFCQPLSWQPVYSVSPIHNSSLSLSSLRLSVGSLSLLSASLLAARLFCQSDTLLFSRLISWQPVSSGSLSLLAAQYASLLSTCLLTLKLKIREYSLTSLMTRYQHVHFLYSQKQNQVVSFCSCFESATC